MVVGAHGGIGLGEIDDAEGEVVGGEAAVRAARAKADTVVRRHEQQAVVVQPRRRVTPTMP